MSTKTQTEMAKMERAINRKLATVGKLLEEALNLTHEYDTEIATQEERYAVQGKREAIVLAMTKAHRVTEYDIAAAVLMHMDTTKRLNTNFTTTSL
jgi:phage host-nuclease inhibitor protein Gam